MKRNILIFAIWALGVVAAYLNFHRVVVKHRLIYGNHNWSKSDRYFYMTLASASWISVCSGELCEAVFYLSDNNDTPASW